MQTNGKYLNTQVSYQFTAPDSLPMVGPGAQLQVSFGTNSAGKGTRLLYAARELYTGSQYVSVFDTIAARHAIRDLSSQLADNAATDLLLPAVVNRDSGDNSPSLQVRRHLHGNQW